MKTQKGFTLIELIVVIVILGILAATAMPKFAGLQADARKAAAQGAQGAISSAANLAHAAWLAAGSSAATTVTMEGQTINMTNGYPSAAAAGIDRAAGLEGTASYTVAGAGPRTFTPNGVTTAANCQVSYNPPAAAGGSPTITLTVTDCN